MTPRSSYSQSVRPLGVRTQPTPLPTAKANGKAAPDWRATLAAWLALPAVLYAAAFPALRPLGEVPLLIAAATSAAAIVMGARLVVSPAQTSLIFLSAIWLALSLVHVLPPSWTRYFDTYAAIRHWSWTLLIPLFVSSTYVLLVRFGQYIYRHALIFAGLYAVVSRAAMLVADRHFNWLHLCTLYDVQNTTIPIQLLLLVVLFRSERLFAIDLALAGALLAVSTSSTNLIASFLAIVIRFAPTFRLLPSLFGLALISALAIAPHYYFSIYQFDHNAGVRAVMWRDALQSVIDTGGVGVGYGTEYFKNEFAQIAQSWTLAGDYASNRLYISTHSAFYDVLLRTGIAGLLLFLLWMARYANSKPIGQKIAARLYCAIACALYIDVAFNPGIISVEIFIGISFMVATLEWLRAGYPRPQQAQS